MEKHRASFGSNPISAFATDMLCRHVMSCECESLACNMNVRLWASRSRSRGGGKLAAYQDAFGPSRVSKMVVGNYASVIPVLPSNNYVVFRS